MVAKTSASPAPVNAADNAARRQARRHSPSNYHVKIACDLCAVAILLGLIALYLAILLVA